MRGMHKCYNLISISVVIRGACDDVARKEPTVLLGGLQRGCKGTSSVLQRNTACSTMGVRWC
jgi:hypothetical protein